MAFITFTPHDINRFLPDIEPLLKETKEGNYTKTGNTLYALSESKLSTIKSDDEKQRCFTFLSLCHEGLVQQKLDSRLVLNVQRQFVNCAALPKSKLPKKMICIGKNNEQITIKTTTLMTHTLEFTKGFFVGKPAEENTISLLDVPIELLTSFNDYLSSNTLCDTLSIEDLTALYRFAREHVVEDLCRACFEKVQAAEKTSQYSEIVAAFLFEKDRTISEEEKTLLGYTFITTLLTQSNVAYLDLKRNKIALSLKEIYLLNQNNSTAQILTHYVTGLFLHTEEDLQHIGQLHLAASTITWLDISIDITPETFEKIVSLLPNIQQSAIRVGTSSHVAIFDTIAAIQTLRHLHLYVPSQTVAEESILNSLCRGIKQFVLSQSITPSVTYVEKNCTLSMTRSLFDRLTKQIEIFTMDRSCDIDFSLVTRGVFSYPMGLLRDRFSNSISLNISDKYYFEEIPTIPVIPRKSITKFSL